MRVTILSAGRRVNISGVCNLVMCPNAAAQLHRSKVHLP